MFSGLHGSKPASEYGDTAMQQGAFKPRKFRRQLKCCAAQKLNGEGIQASSRRQNGVKSVNLLHF
jgi:hypothetical protein